MSNPSRCYAGLPAVLFALSDAAVLIAPTSLADTGSSPLEEVVVTARLRTESAFDVPVAISALTGEQLDQKGLTDLSAIANEIPELRISEGVIGFGGQIALRGVSSTPSTSSVDQAVSFNIDGMPVSHAAVVRLGQFDIRQLEVLKGPQALFFGKNSTGGIVSMRSAEPSEEFEFRARADHETEAEQTAFEAYVSGPISDTVAARIAIRQSQMEGWLDNPAPNAIKAQGPDPDELLIKAALNFDLSETATVKLKAGYSSTEVDHGFDITRQAHFCPFDLPQYLLGGLASPASECRSDNVSYYADFGPVFGSIANAGNPRFYEDGRIFSNVEQQYLIGEFNVEIGNSLSFTSITSYIQLDLESQGHIVWGGDIPLLAYNDETGKETFSQEFRLFSNDNDRFNWMVGVFLQQDEFGADQAVHIFDGVTEAVPTVGVQAIDSQTISPFVQVDYRVAEKLILSAGVRYTDETKEFATEQLSEFLINDNGDFRNFSPEITLSYQLTDTVNSYLSYREGFKSGGFQVEHIFLPTSLTLASIFGDASPLPLFDNQFDEEEVRGFEAGLKAELFNSRLRMNAAIYNYEYTDLQLGRFDPDLAAILLDNVGASTSRGVEFDFSYSLEALSGLTIRGAVAYLEHEFDEYVLACYNGQTVEQGCDLTSGTQDATGETLPLAPEWSGSLGLFYVGTLGEKTQYRLNLGASYTDDYSPGVFPSLVGAEQASYTTIDAGIAFTFLNGAIDVAFVGKNLTDEFWVESSNSAFGTGGNFGTGIFPDLNGVINRGRQYLFRLTYTL